MRDFPQGKELMAIVAIAIAFLLLVAIGIWVARANPRQADWPAPWESR